MSPRDARRAVLDPHVDRQLYRKDRDWPRARRLIRSIGVRSTTGLLAGKEEEVFPLLSRQPKCVAEDGWVIAADDDAPGRLAAPAAGQPRPAHPQARESALRQRHSRRRSRPLAPRLR
jgi:hypothetical protein